MSRLTKLTISTGLPNGEPSDTYARHYLRSDEGMLAAKHSYRDNTYDIVDYYINEPVRRQGYGKEFLKIARKHAHEVGALAISASDIVSRESVEAITSVFGKASVSIHTLGEYEENPNYSSADKTKARMLHIFSGSAGASDYDTAILASIQDIDPAIQALNERLISINSLIVETERKAGPWLLKASAQEVQDYEKLKVEWQATVEQRSLLLKTR